MPFISKDWRSPGEEWVRYDGGWEKKSVLTINESPEMIGHLDLLVTEKKQEIKCNTIIRRKKNLSECNADKENIAEPGSVEYHRLLLQEHIRRIRRNLHQVSEDQENQENNGSPQRASNTR